MKKLLSMILAICMVCTLLPFEAFAANATNGKCGDNATWKYSQGTLTISGTGAIKDYGISEKSDEHSRAPWRENYQESIKTIVIESGITAIGNEAFCECANVASVIIPDSVKRVGDFAFSGCAKLADITLPAGLTEIGDDAFELCTALKSVTIPDSVTNIGSFAFFQCTGLKEITIPARVSSIGNCAFCNCTSLTAIGVAGENKNYTSVNGVLMSKDKTEIISYPCGKQGAYTVPDHVTSIVQGAFYCSDGLTEVAIPAGVTKIENFAFERCENLENIFVAGGNKNYASEDGVLMNKSKTVLICCPGGKQGSYAIPNSVKAIEASAFEFCRKLTGITIPDGVKAIEESTFTACTALKSITIPNGVTKIGEFAFDSCESLSNVIIPDSVVSMGMGAFSDCSSLTEVTLPGGIKSIEPYMFIACGSLKSVFIPTDVVSVAANAFDGCTSLKEINYAGSEAQWKAIEIMQNNEPLLKAKVNFNAKPEATAFFADVKSGAYYYESVTWAYKHEPQITSGMDSTHFQPDTNCTRAQIVTFLWRAKGCPTHKPTKCPFADVPSKAYYYDAVMWAVENGITKGIDETHFAPNNTCTRAQAVTFLWRADDYPKTANTSCPFKDVDAKQFYYDAMLWAVGEQITNGMDATHFAPNNTCTRGQIVTLLYRDTNIK